MGLRASATLCSRYWPDEDPLRRESALRPDSIVALLMCGVEGQRDFALGWRLADRGAKVRYLVVGVRT